MERTEKGRIHIHMLTNLDFSKCSSKSNEYKSDKHKQQEQEFEKLWSYKGNVLGWVDIRSINQDECRKCSLYLATYLNKSMYETKIEKQKHLYGYSKRTLEKPIIDTFEEVMNIEQILRYFSDFEVTYSGSYPIVYKDNEVGNMTYIDLYLKEY